MGGSAESLAYLELAETLAELDPATYVFGGIAEDVVLSGTWSRPHDDIDVLVARDQLDAALSMLAGQGVAGFEVYFESPPGSPLVLGTSTQEIQVELGVFDPTDSGAPSFVLPSDQGSVTITLPPDTLTAPIGTIDGRRVRTVSPLALFHLRAAFMQTGAFGPPREKDLDRQAALRDGPLAGIAPKDLVPTIEANEPSQ